MRNTRISSPNNSADPEIAIHRFTRKLRLLLALKYSLIFCTIWTFAWGLIALIWRVVGNASGKYLLWGAVGFVVAIIAAIVMAKRQLPKPATVRALLDEQNHCGGLLMASENVEIGDWQDKIPSVNLPTLRWRNSKNLGLFAASIAFVIAALLVPVRFASMNNGRGLDVSREVNDLAQKIETLKEEQILDQTKAETLEQKLDQVGQDATGEDPVKTWEALDHLSDAVEKAAKEASESAMANQEKLAQVSALAEGLMAGKDQMDAKLMTEAMKSLSAMMQGAMQENQSLANNLTPELQEAIKNGSLKPEQLKDLAKALGQNRSALNQKLSKLNQAGLNKSGMIDPKSLKGGAQADRRSNAGLAQFLKENAQKMSIEDAVEAWGKGGVDRGRGDAAMTWNDPTSEKDAKFKEKTLPPSAIDSLKESQLVGLSAGAPTIENKVTAHGALNSAAAGGGSAYTQTVLPRHKGAVKRYFERTQK